MLAREPVPELGELPPVNDGEDVLAVEPQVQPPIPVPAQPAHHDDATVRRSNRERRPSRCLRESLDSHLVQVMESIIMDDEDPISGVQPLLAYAMSNDPDILTVDRAMRAPDAEQFRAEMSREFNAHCDKGHWVFVRRDSIPHGTKVLPPVWAMRRKRSRPTGSCCWRSSAAVCRPPLNKCCWPQRAWPESEALSTLHDSYI